MYNYISNLIMYRNIDKDSILVKLGDVFREIDHLQSLPVGQEADEKRSDIIREINNQVYRLLDISTKYGFNENLWKCYISYILATNENPFSVISEKVGLAENIEEASALSIVRQDMQNFYEIFNYDFSKINVPLGMNPFDILTSYKSIAKSEHTYNKSVSEKVYELYRALDGASDGEKFFEIIGTFYQKYGVGSMGLNKAFRVKHDEMGQCYLSPITHTSDVVFDDLVGYEMQKEMLIANTQAFVDGKRANNCLLFGDSGTGKSTCIKALLNKFYPDGLRLIEVYKHQFQDLSRIIEIVKNRNYKFIIYMDDLSFEEFEIEYKYLKAIIEGGLEIKPDNVLIYATSNRRHLIRETWSDRSDMSADELHRSDTMQEKLSLVARFGISINFSKPMKKEFENIVLELAKKNPDIHMDEKELLLKANAWSLRNGGYSGRVAEQFIISISSKE
ncbi:ATP-binding protein [Eubacterium xylanophilum]|uniref:ATP-binding protein n=1 Tax=Eubacterium xylanophilum TaxID=39497 RepID=UPI000479DFBF|nr:ATP-binding protein [Eubacterium xylanophilum]